MFRHIPVLTGEILESFGGLEKSATIVDGTLGKGGHSKILLENGFQIIGIDRDKEAISEAKKNLKGLGDIKFIHGNFSELGQILQKMDIREVDGILLDLGVSTHQLEKDGRGFGFTGRLDMRMNREEELTAKKVVNEYPEEKLAVVLYEYGERVHARQIARTIVRYRKKREIETCGQLLKLIKYSMPEGYRKTRKHHWATPTFRALRIEVNKDYEHLEKFLEIFPGFLKKGGILSVITFHSLEESIVRKRLRLLKQKEVIKLITKRGIKATKKETSVNPKAKHAKLWVAEKKHDPAL